MDLKDSWPACVWACAGWCRCIQRDAQPDTRVNSRSPHTAPRTHRVPYLQLDLLAVDVDHARAELHANREVVHGLEALVRELQQQAGLAHTCAERC